ncbi:MAG: HutD family protein, partial [Oscillospiraceae bacterium]
SGGSTTQLAIHPDSSQYQNRDFIWRLSSATVEDEHSSFTCLPHYNRIISVITGDIRLVHPDCEIQVLPGVIHSFDGGESTECFGVCTDFNLMMKKGVCCGSVDFAKLSPSVSFSSHCDSAKSAQFENCFCAIYPIDGDVDLWVLGQNVLCPKGSLGLIEGPATDISLTSRGSVGAFVCFIYC